jgi:hypothetical protein
VKEVKIHYSGGLRIITKSGGVSQMFAGYPCCAYGPRAEKIRRNGNQTDDTSKVTCGSCRKLIERARANGTVGTGDHTRVTLEPLQRLLQNG